MYHRWSNKFLITVPIHQSQSEEIGNALIESIITKYGVPEYIIMDQDIHVFTYKLFIQEVRH